MKKRWRINKEAPAEIIEQLTKEVNVSSVIANLLYQRGVTNYNEAKSFFRPKLEHLHSPFQMQDMQKAVDRVQYAIENGDKILVYGDYDVDGTTAVALVYSFLKTFYDKVEYYIPDRYKEGYGISNQGIDYASAHSFALIIALDCGIKSVDKIDYANQKKIDFIICDHHFPGDTIPNAIAVLDPKRKDCNYPYKELSGCGVGFKLVQAIALVRNIPIENLEPYLDLVVISIAADIVPITQENRILAYYGLQRLNTSPRKGIQAMLELAEIKRSLTISDIVFVIGPRINAAGRMESGNKAVELLTSESAEQATESGIYLNKNNADRRDLDVFTTQQALAMIAESSLLQQRKSTTLFNPQWHKGVIGIVASRLTETYYRPTILLTQSNGIVSGSARSVKDFDIYEAIDTCSHLLEQFGGHKYAAGLTLKPENVDAFFKAFEKVVATTITDEMLIPEIEIDATINLNDITPAFYNIIKQFAPFGPGNMNPTFFTKNVVNKGNASIVGNNHLKLILSQLYSDGRVEEKYSTFSAIGFRLGEHYDFISKTSDFSICYGIKEQEWEGKSFLQLELKDIRGK